MGKSSRHQSKNTFKFKKFSDRISNLKIDVIHKIKRPEDDAEVTETYFGAALFKWCSLNLTNDFNNFKTEISDQVKTFVQLVHHSDKIVASLLKHLAVPNSMAYDALLDLVVQLAKDLQHDFYKHFPDIFKILVALLKANSHDIQVLELVFTCLSYLIKFLWRYMIKDIKNVIRYFLPLLSTQNKSYIREFAAESFGFLIRKVKDQSELLDFVFGSLNKRSQHTAGISRLLFEVLKSVQNHVHSCAVKVFPIILSKLGPDPKSDNTPNQFILNQIEVCVTQMMEALAAHVDGTDHISHLWPILLEEITKHHQFWLKGENSAPENLQRLLNVTSVWLKFKHGALVSEPDKVSNTLSVILKSENILPDSTLCAVLNCVSLLVYGCCERISMSNLSRVINLSFNKKIDADIVYPFAKTLFSMPLFEKNVLYPLMEFMQSTMKEKDASVKVKSLLMATEVIFFKISLPLDASELDDYQHYPMDFNIVMKRTSTKGIVFSDYVQSLISDTNLDNRWQLVLTWAAIVCMPHIRPKPNCDVLKKLIKEFWICITCSDEEPSLKDLHLFILAQAVQRFYLMVEESQFFECITLDEVELLLKSYSDNIHALQVVDIFFWLASRSTNMESVCNSDTCLRIYSFLEQNLSSASHQVRLLTVQILSQFQLSLPITDNPDIIQVGVFNICLEAERTPRTVQDYRDIIKHLQKLDSSLIKNSIPSVDPRFNQVPLRFLLGNLFCKFKPIWEPVRKLITSYATFMSKEDFWEVFGEHLKKAAFDCENNVPTVSICGTAKLLPGEENAEVDTALLQIFREQLENSMKRKTSSATVDHFREQLWKTMLNFPKVCEANSKLLSNLLFQFIENEFKQVNKDSMARQNILNREWKEKIDQIEKENMEVDAEEEEKIDEEKAEETDVNMEDEEDEEEGEDENDAEEETANGIQTVVQKQQKELNNLLVIHLQLFSQFHHGNSLSCSKKLKELFEMLLQHKEIMIQKIAFECLMIFPFKGVGLYRENFMRILEEKTFRDELALFNSDSECCIIEEAHRTAVMSILTRILYGTLQNKKTTVSRKGQVFSFLCSCKLEEQLIFIDLVLKPCEELLADITIPQLMASIDLRNMLPPKVMQSFLNIILLIMRKLGHYIKVYLSKLLKVILGIAATCKVCLDNKHKIYSKAVGQVKTVWKMSLTRLFQFFEIFKSYPYTASEIDSVFDVIVWPKIQCLPVESLKTPTYLLNFLHAWTKSPRFFPCLLKTIKKTEISPMPYVFQLLNSKGISKTVLHVVMEMIYNLVSVEMTEEEESEYQLEEVKREEEECEEKKEQDLSKEILVLNGCPKYSHNKQELGIQILKPHIPTLLEYLQRNISSVISRLNRKNASCRELTILSKITNLVTSSKQCPVLVSLLLSILAKKGKRSWETELDLLTSILNMIPVIKKDILNLYRKVICLFTSIKHRRPRKVLCDIVQKLSEKQSSLEKIAKILHQLNSWNPNRIEEPDFHQRLEGFKVANKIISDMEELDVNFLLPLVHNCCFFIISLDDFSIKDNSTNCLVTIINQFDQVANKDKFAYQEVIERTILPQIKAGIGGVNQSVRAEFCTVLRAVAIKFSSRKPFDDLVKITDKDPDTDFFENIKHIQVHRRTRALRRLANNLASYKMERETLLLYLLPIANGYLQTKFKKIEGLQEAAIELLGALCSQLPWKIYQKQLRYYLNKITTEQENHKLMMKIVIAILDGFHFDLSNSIYTVTNANNLINHVLEKEEKEKKEEDEDEEDTRIGKQSASGRVICPAGMATRIHSSIVNNILPKLYRCLIQKVRSETEHKLVKSKYAEDFEILRVPIALTMIKLLKNLPEDSLKSNLPSILLRVCQFLKSRSQDIRKSSRDTLVKIAQSLGPSYFPYILSEMKSALTRGYQLHVLGFTTHSLLQALSGQLKIGDLDSCLKSLIEVFNEDIFGEVAEEKTVEALVSKLMEAKNCKSFNSYQVLAKYMSTNYMTALISPLKQILDNTNSHKVSQKVELVLKRLIIGLAANKSLEVHNLMIFIYSLVCQTLPLLVEKKMDSEKLVHPLETKVESCLILPKAPTREGKKSKVSKKTNMHILVEFGLKLLFYIFKQSRLKSSEVDHLQLLDPFVGILIDCLASKHIKVIICAIKSLCIMLKFPLPAMKTNVKRLADNLFILLNSFAASGAARGENAELVFILFRIVTILVREINYYNVKPEQLQVLVMYCEEDICDYTRQSSAFTLIKAILYRKLKSPEITEMMNLIKTMAITSEVAHIRKQCREVVLRYLLDYPVGMEGQNYVQFFVKHLDFSIEEGRLSAIEILTAIIRTFPPELVADQAVFFYLPLSASLINDKSAACRKNIASAIKMLIEKLDSKMRQELFTFVVKWHEDKKLQLQTVAAQLLGLYVEVEKEQFNQRLMTVLPLLNKSFMLSNSIKETKSLANQNDQDHFLYNNLNTMLKVLRCCDVAKNSKWIERMNKLWEHVQNYLRYPHTWVQLMSGQLFGLLFTSYPPDELVADILRNSSQKSKQPVPYLVKNGQKKIHSLVMDSVAQLQSPLLQKAQAEQAVKNLVYLAKVIKRLNIQQGIIDPSSVPEINGELVAVEEENGKIKDVTEREIEDESKMEEEEEEMETVEYEEKLIDGNEAEENLEEEEEDLEEEEDFEKILKKYSNDVEEEEKEKEKVEEKTDELEEKVEYEELISCEEDISDEVKKQMCQNETHDEDDESSEVTLPWIVRKMTREAHYENIHNPKCTLKRSFVFKWFAAVAVDLGANLLASVLHIMLPALHRELNDTVRTQDANLKNLTQEVVELLKNTVGIEVFSYKYAIVHRDRKERSESRKRKKAIQVITNPEIAYKRKIKRNLVKKQSKKRKIELLRPEKALKKKKMTK